MLSGKKVVVCDYPSKYLFPPNGYGGIERWLWTVAKESVNIGMEVILLGPQWQFQLLPKARFLSDRILDISIENFLKNIGYVDYLVAGHEYWMNKDLLKKFEAVACCAFTYQHSANIEYAPGTFNNKRNFLFCYSDEMCELYKQQSPIKLLCVAGGYNEEPKKEQSQNYLLSIGRIEQDKAQHYAILAAAKLNMPIYILGDIVNNNGYVEEFREIFNMPHVKRFGMIHGEKKMELIARSACGIYTLGKQYTESAAGTISEIIRSGVPLAGLTWKGNDAVSEPININPMLGFLSKCTNEMNDDEVVERLAIAIKNCLNLNRDSVYIFGNSLYNPTKLVKQMYLIAEQNE